MHKVDFSKWYAEHPIKAQRNYKNTIIPRVERLEGRKAFKSEQYGSVDYRTYNGTNSCDTVTHSLFCILVGDLNPEKPTYIILGGTHGYEKSGPFAALEFLENEAEKYTKEYNLIVYPCLCPGPYEKELRYTEGRIDPNRDALLNSPKSQEMIAFTQSIKDLHKRLLGIESGGKFTASIDLHETPKMDLEINAENARIGAEQFKIDIFPEGWFLIAFEEDKKLAERIVQTVKDSGFKIVDDETIYEEDNHGGMILKPNLDMSIGLVRNFMKLYSEASFTTEFSGLSIDDNMPDSERIAPQMAAIKGMLTA